MLKVKKELDKRGIDHEVENEPPYIPEGMIPSDEDNPEAEKEEDYHLKQALVNTAQAFKAHTEESLKSGAFVDDW